MCSWCPPVLQWWCNTPMITLCRHADMISFSLISSMIIYRPIIICCYQMQQNKIKNRWYFCIFEFFLLFRLAQHIGKTKSVSVFCLGYGKLWNRHVARNSFTIIFHVFPVCSVLSTVDTLQFGKSKRPSNFVVNSFVPARFSIVIVSLGTPRYLD